MMQATASRLAALTGGPRLLIAFCAGALATAALPPLHIIPALWIALPLLLWLLDGCGTWRSALACGWAFGFGHCLTGLFWIADAFYVDADAFGMLAIPAVLGLTWGLGIFFSVVTVITGLIPPAPAAATDIQKGHRTIARALLFASAWMLQEWTRNWILTGFPWNPIATVWSESVTPFGLALQQSVSVIGTFGLSLVTVAAASLFALMGAKPSARAAGIWMGGPLALLALMAAAGLMRLETDATYTSNVKLRLVQPNVPQAEKWRANLYESHLQDYVVLSTVDRPADVNVVVWGEASVSFLLDRDEAHRRIAAAAAPSNGLLIAGADRAESETRIFNSLYVIAPDSAVVATYDKHHLVPFGEFMPLAGFLPWEQLTGGIGFSTGPGGRTMAVPGLPPFAPLICFEAIFPGQVVTPGTPAPRWMLNLTNDSWFGTLTGPYQHFATARLRAIEQGLPLVRAANTGISAVVDPYGRVLAQLGLDRRGVVDAPLPDPITGPIPFALWGNFVSLLFATMFALSALLLYRGTRV